MEFRIDLGIISILLLIGGLIFFIAQLVYYLNFLAKPMRYQETDDERESSSQDNKPPVSIIITAKNESRNLTTFLPQILEQDYPLYEVIVVNDGSTDDTERILGDMEVQYKHLYQTYVPRQAKYLSRKKLAVTIGIKAAKYDVLLFTEANCMPLGKNWISSMCRHFDKKTDVVLGFNTMTESTSLISKYAVYDNLFSGLQYLSLAIKGNPYMGVGRNLAYRKNYFYDNKGFSKRLNLQVGEDDLFINEIANSYNTSIEISPDGMTASNLDDVKIWEEIKISHITTQRYYKRGPVAFWRFEAISRYLFGLFAIGMTIYGWNGLFWPIVAVVLFLSRFGVQLFVINKSAMKLQTEKFYCSLFFFDLIQPLINSYYYVYCLFKSKRDYTWR